MSMLTGLKLIFAFVCRLELAVDCFDARFMPLADALLLPPPPPLPVSPAELPPKLFSPLVPNAKSLPVEMLSEAAIVMGPILSLSRKLVMTSRSQSSPPMVRHSFVCRMILEAPGFSRICCRWDL